MRAVITLGLGGLGAGCGGMPDPVPIVAPETLTARLRGTGVPDAPWLVEFRWTYRGREGRFSGEGGVRINPPDSIRLDLFGPGWSGIQSAVMVGEGVRYVGEQRIELPPPTFLWALFGVFRPPAGLEAEAFRRGREHLLAYRLSPRRQVVFEFTPDGRLAGAEMHEGAHAIQRIRLTPGASDSIWPKEAVYRDLREYHEVRVQLTGAREHEPFDEEIFRVAAR